MTWALAVFFVIPQELPIAVMVMTHEEDRLSAAKKAGGGECKDIFWLCERPFTWGKCEFVRYGGVHAIERHPVQTLHLPTGSIVLLSSGMYHLRHQFHAERLTHPVDRVEAGL